MTGAQYVSLSSTNGGTNHTALFSSSMQIFSKSTAASLNSPFAIKSAARFIISFLFSMVIIIAKKRFLW